MSLLIEVARERTSPGQARGRNRRVVRTAVDIASLRQLPSIDVGNHPLFANAASRAIVLA